MGLTLGVVCSRCLPKEKKLLVAATITLSILGKTRQRFREHIKDAQHTRAVERETNFRDNILNCFHFLANTKHKIFTMPVWHHGCLPVADQI